MFELINILLVRYRRLLKLTAARVANHGSLAISVAAAPATDAVGRGSLEIVSFVAAVSLAAQGHLPYAKMSPVSGFTREALKKGVLPSLVPGSDVLSDAACFSAVVDTVCTHSYIVVG